MLPFGKVKRHLGDGVCNILPVWDMFVLTHVHCTRLRGYAQGCQSV
jgi:hypothetical protein